MGVPFTKPDFEYDWSENEEYEAIKKLQNEGQYKLPKPQDNQILFGTWNIANLDIQKRTDSCFPLIAEIIRPFDLVAIQEVNANLIGIQKIMKILGDEYSYIFTDVAGNDERLCYIYKQSKIALTQEIGELAVSPKSVKQKEWKMQFEKNGEMKEMEFLGFDRNPYVVTWKFNDTKFTTYNCHLYFGKKSKKSDEFRRRIFEIYVLAKWADERRSKPIEIRYSDALILLGDMNVPSMKKDDPVYEQLTKFNMEGVRYDVHVKTGSNVLDDSTYDQLVFTKPFSTKINLIDYGIFAWDRVIFSTLWEETKKTPPTKKADDFTNYVKWAISDHRPLWSLLEILN